VSHQIGWALERSGGCMAKKEEEKKEVALFWEMVLLYLCPRWQA